MSLARKLLLTLMVIGAMTSTVSAGTFASFSASTTNTASFATGTLTLTNDGPAAGTCVSAGPGDNIVTNTKACDQLFNVTLAKPGDTAQVDLTLQASGSVTNPSGTLTGYKTSACSSGNAPAATHNGGGNPCSAIEMYIQEYTSAARTTTDGTCEWPTNGSTACSSTFAPAGTDELDDYPLSAAPVAMGTLTTTPRYFRIYLRLPSNADNTMQGMQASFGFSWQLTSN